jgi:hypothetical protein
MGNFGLFHQSVDLGFVYFPTDAEKLFERAGPGALGDGQVLFNQMLQISLWRHAKLLGAGRQRGGLLLAETANLKWGCMNCRHGLAFVTQSILARLRPAQKQLRNPQIVVQIAREMSCIGQDPHLAGENR